MTLSCERFLWFATIVILCVLIYGTCESYYSERTKRVQLEQQHIELRAEAIRMAEFLDSLAVLGGVSCGGLAEYFRLEYNTPAPQREVSDEQNK